MRSPELIEFRGPRFLGCLFCTSLFFTRSRGVAEKRGGCDCIRVPPFRLITARYDDQGAEMRKTVRTGMVRTVSR